MLSCRRSAAIDLLPAALLETAHREESKSIPETGPELHEHLSCFVDTNVKVYGMVAGRENFVRR